MVCPICTVGNQSAVHPHDKATNTRIGQEAGISGKEGSNHQEETRLVEVLNGLEQFLNGYFILVVFKYYFLCLLVSLVTIRITPNITQIKIYTYLFISPHLGPYDNWVMSEYDVPTPLRFCRGHI